MEKAKIYKIPFGWKGCMITINTKYRRAFFGVIENGRMHYSKAGVVAGVIWFDIANCRQNIMRKEFVIMPDHMHGIILYRDITTASELNSKNQIISISSLIGSYKSAVTKHCNNFNIEYSWQNGYHEQTIRSDWELETKIKYINNNIKNWSK